MRVAAKVSATAAAIAGATLLSSTVAHAVLLRHPLADNPKPVNYGVDHGGVDYACGGHFYSGHTGNDFSVGVGTLVVAAAPGVVTQVINGCDDWGYVGNPCGGQCGNYVQIDHGDGTRTLYCHMANGSPMVGVGDEVACGQPIGLTASSGSSSGPHLHLALRPVGGSDFDPYAGICSGPDSSWVQQNDYDVGPSPVCSCAPEVCDGLDNDCNGVVDDGGACNAPPTGNIDAADCTSIRGWSQDPTAPAQPIAVHLYFDGPAGAGAGVPIVANLYRPDLCQALGSCDHAFEARVPAGLRDGKPHTVHAYGIDTTGGTNPALAGSGASFSCPPLERLAPERAVRRWVVDPGVFDAYRFSLLDLVKVPEAAFQAYREGNTVDAPPKLVRAEGGTKVFLVDDGVKRWVPSMTTLHLWRLNETPVEVVPPAAVDAMPEGPALPPEPALIKGDGPQVVMIDERPGGGVWLPVEDTPDDDGAGHTDIDGDGKADLCGRGPGGFVCHLAVGGAEVPGPALPGSEGWDTPAQWSTVRMADVTGDGRADLCARSSERWLCWPSQGSSFASSPIEGPAMPTSGGWGEARYQASVRLLDFTGDGKADLCARQSDGVVCWPSTGQGFGPQVEGPELSDGLGWADEANGATMRSGDVDGDGRDDLCARADAKVLCWLSNGTAPLVQVDGPALSDAAGFAAQKRWGTLRLADIDGDGRDDVCARVEGGFSCWRSTGKGFGPEITGPELTDEQGWGDPTNWTTLRMGDVTGDGKADLCARADAGWVCWPSTGQAFGPPITGPTFADAAGWSLTRYHRTMRLADIDGDGKADVCARSKDAVLCWRSDGKGFPVEVEGPAWGDLAGWQWPQHHGTLRLASPRPKKPQGSGGAGGSGQPNDAGGSSGMGGAAGSMNGGPGGPSTGAGGWPMGVGGATPTGSGPAKGSGAGAGGGAGAASGGLKVEYTEESSGCGVGRPTPREGRAPGWVTLAMVSIATFATFARACASRRRGRSARRGAHEGCRPDEG